MAKKQTTETISHDIKQLSELKVKKVTEQTEIYNEKIKQLESKIDLFYYGIKTK